VHPADLLTSTELIGWLGQATRLANAAARPDLVERLVRARGEVAGRQMHVVVLGAPGQGTTSLAQVLERTPVDQLPGASFADAPGSSGTNQLRLPQPDAADVVLLVSDASREFDQRELDAVARLRAQGTPLAVVLAKIDIYPRWSDVQRADRRRLRDANLDTPPIPLLPVSAAASEQGRQRGDDSLTVASGVPQLLEHLSDRIGTRVDPALRDWVLGEIRVVTDQLGRTWNGELNALHSSKTSPQERQQRAVTELDRRQQLSANWQIALNDGATELMAAVDFDLRDRLREVMEFAEEDIAKANPMGYWSQFDESLRGKVEENVRDNFELAAQRSRRLAQQVAAKLAGTQDGSHAGVALPTLRVEDPAEALHQIKPMDRPESGGLFARMVNSLRGSYGGVLMVGVLTSLAGLSLISVYSVGAGVLLGLFTFWEDRKNGKERGKAEARIAVSKLMDNVNFRVGDELRTQLRAVHRALRDHYTALNDQRLRAASDEVRAAAEAAAQAGGDHGEARLAELQNYLAELRQLRIHLSTPAR
jgi:hypothetical protein